jgi:hypothetical protein
MPHVHRAILPANVTADLRTVTVVTYSNTGNARELHGTLLSRGALLVVKCSGIALLYVQLSKRAALTLLPPV